MYRNKQLKIVHDARRIMASSAVFLHSQQFWRPGKSVGAHSMSVVESSSIFVLSTVLGRTVPPRNLFLQVPSSSCFFKYDACNKPCEGSLEVDDVVA
jgi:hypothetical protein